MCSSHGPRWPGFDLLTHVQATSTNTETETGRPEILAIATFAVDFTLIVTNGSRIQTLVAFLAVEARRVEVHTGCGSFLCVVHASTTSWATSLDWSCTSTHTMTSRLVRHLAIDVAEVFTLVHRQGTSTTTETVSFGSKLAAVADLAEDIPVMFGQVGAFQHLLAQTTL